MQIQCSMSRTPQHSSRQRRFPVTDGAGSATTTIYY
ncbi:hypothetical protein SORBI_3004G099150 [Sorghum bicolor]|uniref:Uncharacterized protein n=1 Tax=Sorghum bicolor TaxID=4558 RepID=A0A1Z5RM55_SORBI|nr:hypothetical protein SORBI_3004G099150 [Sorghum bicolor]